MKEVIWIDETTGFIPGATTLGIVKLNENSCLLVDSGLNRDSARKVLKILEREGLHLVYLFNTHSHADHCGGNSYFVETTGCTIIAPFGETGIVENPIWEPFYLFGGAPVDEMKAPFLMAEGSKVDIKASPGKLQLKEAELDLIDLSGHSPFQLGIDAGCCIFAADSLFKEEIWEKHKFVYFADISKAMETLEKLKEAKKPLVLSHRGICENPEDLVEFNLLQIRNFSEKILETLEEGPFSTDEVLERLCRKLSTKLETFPSYFLARQTLIAYLTYLRSTSKINALLKANTFMWNLG